MNQYHKGPNEKESDELVYGDEALAVEFLNDFIIMQEMKWKPKDIEQLTEFQYEAILATTQTLSSLRKMQAEKDKNHPRARR